MLNSTEQKTLYGLMNMLYPVGSYYITESSDLNTVDKVNAYFGGTWERITDVFLLGAGNSYALGAVGGEEKHTLTVDEMPSHNHTGLYGSAFVNSNVHITDTSGSTAWAGSQAYQTTANTGGSQPHNNMPPYRAVYMYRRKTLATGGGYSLEQLLSLLLTKGGEARC